MKENIAQQVNAILQAHREMISDFEATGVETIIAASQAIIEALRNGGTVYTCGNGGSAADAQHIAGELIGRFEAERDALRAVALTTDTSVITSIANDYDYESVFKRQMEALLGKNDILWALSTSGSSPSILTAAKLAKEKGTLVLAFTGKGQSKLEELADICFCAESNSAARSQEIHQLAYHIICNLVEQSFCEQNEP